MEKKKLKKVFLFLVFLILIAFAFLLDKKILKFTNNVRNFYLDYLFLCVGFASDIFIIFFFLTSLFLWREHKRRWIFPLWLAGLLTVLFAFILKVSIKRPRPFEKGLISVLGVGLYFIKGNFKTWNFSFPSFQAMLVFSALPILNKEFRKFKYIWFVFASLVAFSRVYFGLHYFSDIFVGAILGYLTGKLTIFVEEKTKFGYKITTNIHEKIKI